jgi:hypothetical protein
VAVAKKNTKTGLGDLGSGTKAVPQQVIDQRVESILQ